jgi:replicative DNA helicase
MNGKSFIIKGRKTMSNLRIRPHSEEAEAGVLGSVLLDPSCMDGLSLKPEEFYDRRHSLLWESLQEMHVSNRPLDAITVMEWLRDKNLLDRVGGHDYLLKLQDDTLVSAHSQHYAGIVSEKAGLRSEIDVLSDGLDLAYGGESASDGVLAALSANPSKSYHSDDDIISYWENTWNGSIQTIPLPYESLNVLVGGAPIGMHTVFCGRSGSGKSIFLANWYEFLDSIEFPFLAMPFEDKYIITKTRMAACRGKYSWAKIQRGREWVKMGDRASQIDATEKEKETAKQVLKSFRKTTHIYDRRCGSDDLFGITAKYKAKYGIKALFVDGAKDIQRPSGKYSDTGFDEEISQALCKIAEELDIAVVSVYHLTKIDDDKLITNNSIRGSGNIVSDARCVLALQGAGLSNNGVMVNYDEGGNQTTRSLDVIKSNHSQLGRAVLETDLRKCRFWER